MTVEIQLTHGKVAIIDDEDFDLVVPYKWRLDRGGRGGPDYAVTGTTPVLRMHCLILPTPPGTTPDHVNRNGLDNRRSNLRIATQSQNMANRGPQRNNRSGYKGVSLHKKVPRWQATCRVNGKLHYLGLFKEKDDAARAYDRFAWEHFGEYAYLNFPDALLDNPIEEVA